MGKRYRDNIPDPSVSSRDQDLRDRLSLIGKTNEDDISNIWDEHLESAREKKRIENEYKQAKIKAKDLKKQIKSNYYGTDREVPLSKTIELAKKSVKKVANKLQIITSKVKIYRSIPKMRLLKTARKPSLKHINYKISLFFALPTIFIIAGFMVVSLSKDSNNTLGDSTGSGDQSTQSEQLPQEKPSFDLLYPANKSSDDYESVRISPDGNDPAYTYVDFIDGAQLNITQQQLPDKFTSNKETELESLAKSFQSTNIIRIDDNNVYHGFSEKVKVQSIIFIKKDKLIFIRSNTLLTDDIIAGYIISLN